MTTAEKVSEAIAELTTAEEPESANLFHISALAFAADGTSEFQRVSLFAVASVFDLLARKIDSDPSGGIVGQLSALTSVALKVLSQKGWESGKDDLVELIGFYTSGRRLN